MSRKKIGKSKKTRGERSRSRGDFTTTRLLACDDGGCGLVSFAVPIAETQWDDFVVYMDAHHLIPFDYDYDPVTCAEVVGKSLFVATDDRCAVEQRLKAIAILGHSPCIEALAVLEEVASSDDPLAGVAQLAYGECQGMIETFGISPSPAATRH
jgi:hypothetical protein